MGLIVGSANPGVGIVLVKSLNIFYGWDPDKMRADSIYWSGCYLPTSSTTITIIMCVPVFVCVCVYVYVYFCVCLCLCLSVFSV